MHQENIRTVPKHDNSIETIPYAIQKCVTIYQSEFTLQILSLKPVGPM